MKIKKKAKEKQPDFIRTADIFRYRFARAVCVRRKEHGYTQTQLAELAHCSVRWIQKIEKGRPCGLLIGLRLILVLEIPMDLFSDILLQPEDDAEEKLMV